MTGTGDVDVVAGAAVGLLRAHLAGDEAAVLAVWDAFADHLPLAAAIVGVLLELVGEAGIEPDTLDARLAAWQRARLEGFGGGQV